MRRRSSLPVLVLVGIALASCTPPAADDYSAALGKARTAKDEMLRTEADSPIPRDKRQTVLPLEYFPPDPAYRVPAALSPDPAGTRVVQMLTSTGEQRPTQVMGLLEFTLQGQRLKLRAFAEEGSNGERLFVPSIARPRVSTSSTSTPRTTPTAPTIPRTIARCLPRRTGCQSLSAPGRRSRGDMDGVSRQ
jgi:uncharacterized protein (DUF1684 family)